MTSSEFEPEQPQIPIGIRRGYDDFWPSTEPFDRPADVDSGVQYGPKSRGQLADELIAANFKENEVDIERGYNPKVAHGRTALHLMGSKAFTSEETSAALEVIGARAKELGIPGHRVDVNLARLTSDGVKRVREQPPELDIATRRAGHSAE